MNKSEAPRVGAAVLAVTTLSAFVTPFLGSSINVALPSIGKELSLDAVTLAWVNTSYMLAIAMLLLPFGRMADLHGRRRFFILGTWVFTLVSVLAAMAPNGTWLIVGRILQGIGGGMVFATSAAILTSSFPEKDRGKVLGLNVTGVYLGLTLGPFLGGYMVQAAGWRSILWLNLPLGLLILALAYRHLPDDGKRMEGRMDWIGALFYSLALGGLVFGFSKASGAMGRVLAISSLLFFWAFYRWENRVKDPMLDMKLLTSNRLFLFSNIAALINYSSTTAVVFLLSLYLQIVQGLSPSGAGKILLVQPLVMAALSGAAGVLSDRVGARVLASVGMALSAAGLAAMAFLDASSPVSHVTAILVVLGVGFGIFSSPNTSSIMGSVAPHQLGVASASMGTVRMTGQVLSMGLATLVLTLIMGNKPIDLEHQALYLSSMSLMSGLFAVFSFAGIFVSLARGRAPKR